MEGKMWLYLHLTFFTVTTVPVLSWNLLNFASPDTQIGQVVVWRNKAYICLPRYELGTVKATLIEAAWPESMNYTQQPTQQVLLSTSLFLPRAYPDLRQQQEGRCSSLQNVTALDLDTMRGRLWILDAGNVFCWPKILVLDVRRHEEISRLELKNVQPRILTSIVADPVIGAGGPRAYVGDPFSGSLMVVWARGWWRLLLDASASENEMKFPHMVTSATMTMSRREPTLYMTSPWTDRLFSLNVSAIRASSPPKINEKRRQAVTFLGFKLGPSTGLVMDISAGLNYFLPRDYAAVRWDTKRPLSAESHTILLQSSDILPQVNHMFLDPQWQVWAVVGHHCVKIDKYTYM